MHNPTSPPDLTLGLADDLKRATWPQHKLAEKTGFIGSILRQTGELKTYILYLRNLHHVYEGIEQRSKPSGATDFLYSFLDTKLQRSTPLRRDLEQLTGGKWQELPVLDSAIAYRLRINQLVENESIALLGHIYVRYLGDLNGGQVLRKLLAKNLDLNDSALSFYEFPEITNLPLYRSTYRENFNNLTLESEDRQSIVNEAISGFTFNIELSEAIACYGLEDHSLTAKD